VVRPRVQWGSFIGHRTGTAGRRRRHSRSHAILRPQGVVRASPLCFEEIKLKELSKEEAIALTSGRFAAEVEVAIVGYMIPFLWFIPTANNDLKARNGTAFFVTADRTFVVTANHVLVGYLESRELHGPRVHCQLGNLRFNPKERLIARDEKLDIATFSISPDEVRQSYDGKSAMSFDPMAPQIGKGVFFAGFPGRERRRLQPREMESGVFTALTVADNVSDLRFLGISSGNDK
jgi:hypothetical protein